LIVENGASGQSLMNAAGQSRHIRIIAANDDARMGLLVLVQPDEIGTIKVSTARFCEAAKINTSPLPIP
jgi:hypothetical protein